MQATVLINRSSESMPNDVIKNNFLIKEDGKKCYFLDTGKVTNIFKQTDLDFGKKRRKLFSKEDIFCEGRKLHLI
jgi:hypothetical protein